MSASNGYQHDAIVDRFGALWVICHTRRTLPSLADLAHTLGCHPRTVRRYLAALDRGGYPVPPTADARRRVYETAHWKDGR